MNPTRLKLNHLPLESYSSRYTEYLHQIEGRSLGKSFNVHPIIPAQSWKPIQITSGEVLDSVVRPVWCLNQMAELLKQSPVIGHCWFSDFFHMGLEALPYSRSHYRAFSFLWAQTFDIYDFTVKFMDWMRPLEVSYFQIYETVFVACDLLREFIEVSIGMGSKVQVVGLPFSSAHVFGHLGTIPDNRPIDCVYSSRFDVEKNPMFFLELVDKCPNLNFAICTGNLNFKGNDGNAVRRAKELQQQGKLTIHENLDKAGYYHLLASSKVQINTARQDWVSFTLLEALTFGCLPLYPNFRAMPETLFYERDYLYIPEDVADCQNQLMKLLEQEPPAYQDLRGHILNFHNGTLDRIAAIISES